MGVTSDEDLQCDLTRRNFNRSLMGAAVSLPLAQLGLLGSAHASGANLHSDVVKQASRLVNGRVITLNILLPNGSRGNVQPAVDAFSKSTGVLFNFIETPVDDINTKMFLETRADTSSYDLALPATFGIPDLVEAGALAPLDKYARKYQPTGFQDGALYTIGDYYLDELYGYQTDGDTYLMFYNREMMENPDEQKSFSDKHGYPLAVPQTWEQLDAMIEHFYRPDKSQYGGSLFRTPTYLAWEWWVRFHAKGYFPLADDLTPQINNQAGVQALEEMIRVSKFLSPGSTANGLFENWADFAEGNKFCNIGWGGTQKYLNSDKSNVRGKLLFSPTPGGMVNGKLLPTAYFNWGWNYTVSSSSANKELAYLFALFACSPEMSTVAVREQGGYFDPFRVNHYEDPEIKKVYSNDFLKAHRQSMRASIPDLYLSGQSQYFDALRTYLTEANDGKISAQKALDTTAKLWRRIHRKVGVKRQTEQWRFLKSRYPEPARSLLI